VASDEILARINARFEQSDRRWEERDRRWEELMKENRRFNDALLERHARITTELISAIQTGFASLQAEIADQRRQIQAQTQALLHVLDRLPPPQPQA
jgi:hypothetical protein